MSMDFDFDKIYDYNQLTDIILNHLKLETNKILGVTGTSCVGKSTFAKLLKHKIEETGLSVLIIRADNYLKSEYRGNTSFWTYSDEYLKPEHFAWRILWQDIISLQNGKRVRKKCYVRGVGWKKYIEFEPADVIIVEGLFLDSYEASKEMNYHLGVALKATDELITRRRLERDDFYREHYKDFKRSREETLKEIQNTLQAGKSYKIYNEKWNYLEFTIQKDFYAVISEYHIL